MDPFKSLRTSLLGQLTLVPPAPSPGWHAWLFIIIIISKQNSDVTCLLCAAGPLLHAAAQLIRHFPAFRDIVVSVARKTDAQMWPALFAAVGSPSNLLESLLDVGALQSAACCLLIVDRIQGAEEAHGLTLRLIKVSETIKLLQTLHGDSADCNIAGSHDCRL